MTALEATIFAGRIYDQLLPRAEKVKVAHPLMRRAIAAVKKKYDKIDARKIADCLRRDFLPECHMASNQIRGRRRTLSHRNLVIRQTVQIKNRSSGLLMETGVDYNTRRLPPTCCRRLVAGRLRATGHRRRYGRSSATGTFPKLTESGAVNG